MSRSAKQTIPSWLETPSTSQVNPPVETRPQELPFGELSWQDFEKLCLRLARLTGRVEHCQLYGEAGQEQDGIDIYARQSDGSYTVYQCKRVTDFGPAKIRGAVDRFLGGEWADQATTFVLCTMESLRSTDRADEVEIQSGVLRDRGIGLSAWDCCQLSTQLKEHPKLVDDFFGRSWTRIFCGDDVAGSLQIRLDATQVVEFRNRCRIFYEHVFSTHDPGLPVVPFDARKSLALQDRFVLPDVYDRRSAEPGYSSAPRQRENPTNDPKGRASQASDYSQSMREEGSRHVVIPTRQRQSVESWLVVADRSMILGGPGSGKSSLLRFIILDLLSESPRLERLANKWGGFLPVWVPFPLWTKMISAGPDASFSLSELLHRWLTSWDEERLWPLVENALQDERLLLLVDGLDEWTSEAAARVALNKLAVFVRQRNVPAVVTCRPHGYDRLGVQETGWQTGELCDFSESQQKQLSQAWFAFRLTQIGSGSTHDDAQFEREAIADADRFLAELHGAADLQELAKVPLLLCLLIYHRFYNVRLPQSRFKAYDWLVENVISTHPQRRRAAAMITDEILDLSEDDQKSIFARLAYHVQEHLGEGLIDQGDAVRTVEDYLRDSERGFGFGQREAHQTSQTFVDAGEQSIGLLVRWSPSQLGFYHRVFKEYLAAWYLSGLPISEQTTIIETRCADPQWREVILGLLHLSRRSDDVASLVNAVRVQRRECINVEQHYVDLLLCEIAFSDFNCPVGLLRELAQGAFEGIESESWMPQREHLLHYVLEGLRSTRARDLVRAKLQTWFPCRLRWRSYIYNTMTKWPHGPDVTACLFQGMLDEETSNQRSAARALATIAAGSGDAGDKVASLAWATVAPTSRAAAVLCLVQGWPNHPETQRILEVTRDSLSPEVFLSGVLGRIRLGSQTQDDWAALMQLGSRDGVLDYSWRDDLSSALIAGWPQSPATKQQSLEAARQRTYRAGTLERDLAIRLLLEGYPQDDDVVQFCVEQLQTERYPFLGATSHVPWQMLRDHFKGNPRLIEAIDGWIVRQEHQEPEAAMAALVGRTPIAKAKLLSSLGASWPHWPATALLDGWGMQDPEVADGLLRFASGPVREASKIGHLLPQIIADRPTCRARLLELLRDPHVARPDFVLLGLENLGNTQGDTEVVDAALARLTECSNLYREDVIGRLIVGYPSDPRVRSLAQQQFLDHDGNVAAVAWAYGNDAQMRKQIIDIMNPLPTQLRGVIAAHFEDISTDEPFVPTLLRLYDHEPDDQVKALASIAYHRWLKLSGDCAEALSILGTDIVCYGFDHEERRQAAFCGLVMLDRLDLMCAAQESIGGERTCAISVDRGLGSNIPLTRLILQNWDRIKAGFGTEFWTRLTKNADTAETREILWNNFCRYADEDPSAREDALQFLETRSGRTAQSNMLRFMARVQPKSPLLLEYCLGTLGVTEVGSGQSGDSESRFTAAEILGVQFGGDPDILQRIAPTSQRDCMQEGRVVALCEGWPDSSALDATLGVLRQLNVPLSLPAYFHLLSRKGSSKAFFDAIIEQMRDQPPVREQSLHLIIRPITRRIRDDTECAVMLSERLRATTAPSEKSTIPRLLGLARGVSADLRNWCVKEIDHQVSGKMPPEVGFDLTDGELRPVVHALMDALSIK